MRWQRHLEVPSFCLVVWHSRSCSPQRTLVQHAANFCFPPTRSITAFDDGGVSLSSLGWRRPLAARCAQDRFVKPGTLS
jgi:hypothetical protein